MTRLLVVAILLSWPCAGAAQETTLWRNWELIRAFLERQDVEVKASRTRSDVVSIRMEKTDTFESGPFNLEWSRRQVANVKLLEIQKFVYVVLSVDGTRELKAPVGRWHVDTVGVPGFREQDWVWGIAEENTDGFDAMLGVGDRIRGDIRGDFQN